MTHGALLQKSSTAWLLLHIVWISISCSWSVYSAEQEAHSLKEKVTIELVEAMNNLDYDAIDALFDIRAYAEIAGGALYNNSGDRKAFADSFVKARSERSMAREIFPTLNETMRAKFLGLIADNGSNEPAIRIDYESGATEYGIVYLTPKYKIKDLFIASLGKTSTQSLVESAQLSMQPSEFTLSNLLGIKEINEEALNIFRKMGEYRIKGDFKAAYDELMKLPEEMKKSRTVIDTAAQMAVHFNQAKYLNQLETLANYHGDVPETQFMLIDYYFVNGEYDKAQKSLDMQIARFGEDGPLYNLKGGIAAQNGNLQLAHEYLSKGIAVEPDFEPGYWSMTNILIAMQDYEQVIEILDKIQQQFSYSFTKDTFKANQLYSNFTNSEAFRKWNPQKIIIN